MDVSIVIPTKNAGPLFEKVLDMIFSQKTIYEYEVICVDSGSKDQTLEVIKKISVQIISDSGIRIWTWKNQKLRGF